jgi:ribulose-5-phosphate 4-epimerase/fuculose-1-phosphate aldolase
MLEEIGASTAAHSPEAQYASPRVARLREDLALALRAAAHHGLAEGVCNDFSALLPGEQDRYLINPRGLHWSEVGPDDIVLIDVRGNVLAGRHRVEPTALFNNRP